MLWNFEVGIKNAGKHKAKVPKTKSRQTSSNWKSPTILTIPQAASNKRLENIITLIRKCNNYTLHLQDAKDSKTIKHTLWVFGGISKDGWA